MVSSVDPNPLVPTHSQFALMNRAKHGERDDPSASRAFAEFIACWKPKVQEIVVRLAPFTSRRSFDYDALCQAGYEAVWRAVKAIGDCDRGFQTYVTTAIANAVKNHMRQISQRASHEVLWPDEYFATGSISERLVTADAGLAELEREDMLAAVRPRVAEWLRSLPEQKQNLVDLMYHRGLNMAHAARTMGVSRARVSQMHREIVESGRLALADIASMN